MVRFFTGQFAAPLTNHRDRSAYRKIPWRLSAPQKARQRKRLRAVDKVVDTVSAALQRNNAGSIKAVERWYNEMPREQEMLPKNKYTIFDRKEKKYRKGIHSTCGLGSSSALDICLHLLDFR